MSMLLKCQKCTQQYRGVQTPISKHTLITVLEDSMDRVQYHGDQNGVSMKIWNKENAEEPSFSTVNFEASRELLQVHGKKK